MANGWILEAVRHASAWTESSVTLANEPATTGAAAETLSGAGWREWDVTQQVQAMYGGANHGFLIRDTSTSGTREQRPTITFAPIGRAASMSVVRQPPARPNILDAGGR